MVHLVGATLIPYGSLGSKASKTFKKAIYLSGLFLVALGAGGTCANVRTLGADQISCGGPEAIQKFFIWSYWFTNIGSIISVTLLFYVQVHSSYFFAYLIPACSVLISLLILLASKRTYITRPPTENILATTLKIVKQALKASCSPMWSRARVDHWLDRAKTTFGGSYSNSDVEDTKKVYQLMPIFVTLCLYSTVLSQVDLLHLFS